MDLKAYIESGILELYALNVLEDAERHEVEAMLERFPMLRDELKDITEALANYAESRWIKPAERIEQLVLDAYSNLKVENNIAANNLPIINKHSDAQNWLDWLNQTNQLPEQTDQIYMKVLREVPGIRQLLVISGNDIPEEHHDDVYESFLILSGTCECTVAGQVRFMQPGDFMEIPLHTPHQVKITSPKVTAILQYLTV